MITPFIRPIATEGGSFYTFSSAAEDIGFSFNESTNKLRFSKYTLLNIPNIQTPGPLTDTLTPQNYIQFDGIAGAFSNDGGKSLNTYLAESLENYCYNLETIIISDPAYDPNIKRNVSERTFFKWLKELGAIRFRQATNSELSDPSFGEHFVEEDQSEYYNQVVKYIGYIDIVNSVKNNHNAYSEIYIYIPTSHGSQKNILFTATDDVNYTPNMSFTNVDINDPLNNEYLVGRDKDDVQPAGLSTLAIFDSETGGFNAPGPGGLGIFNYWYDNAWTIDGDPGFKWWFENPIANTYFLEPTVFTDVTNDYFRITNGTKTVDMYRSRMDGISMEFNPAAYNAISSNADIDNFGDLAQSGTSSNFEFNAVLVYYDLYDPSNPMDSVENLFGILFLDNVETLSAGGGEIPRYEKFKSNAVTGENGISYGFKINLKFDINAEQVTSEITINDYNTFSLELYIDALNEMQETTRLFQVALTDLAEAKDGFEDLTSLIIDDNDKVIFDKRISELEETSNNLDDLATSADSILALINTNYQEILNITQNKTSVRISYNLDVLQAGKGISLLKYKENNQIIISNDVDSYNLNTQPVVSIENNFDLNPSDYSWYHTLVEYTNYLKITDEINGLPYPTDRDINIYINDSVTAWQKGQKMRIAFRYGIALLNSSGNFKFNIITDATDKSGNGFKYSVNIVSIDYNIFNEQYNKPVIEVVCIDPDTFTFEVDIF